MRQRHFDALRPVCPLCRTGALAVTGSVRAAGDDLLEGIIGCTNPNCLREYPVVDGIPILVANIRGWLAANPLQVLLRDDLSPTLESLLGDVLGPGSQFDTLRQHTGIYAADHYTAGGGAQRLVAHLLDLAGSLSSDAPLLDLGCSVGGTTFTLAARHQRLTAGVDLNFAMLRIASRALREGRIDYPHRRVGVVYERRELRPELPHRDLVDFWCCDAAALPFRDETFALTAALNLIDCVPSPNAVIAELTRTLRPFGLALLSTPYDWTPTVTAYESWLGGHSQRAPHRGSAEEVLKALLPLEIVAEEAAFPWRVRLHDRSTMEYAVHALVARR